MEENKVTIEGVSYKLGDITKFDSGEAYLIDNTPLLAKECEYDFAKKQYIAKNSKDYTYLVKGIIDYDGDFIFGYFSPTYNDILVNTGKGKYRCLNLDILAKCKESYIEDNRYEFVSINNLLVKDKYESVKISKDFKSKFPYSANDKVLEKYLEYFDKIDLKISSGAKQLSNLLDGLSVGVEFETDSGLIAEKDGLKNGLIPLRDGSINGLEYVTIPLSGEKGSQALLNAIQLLHKNAKINHNCALHYHIGNIPRTKEFIVALWIVITLIQNDLYKYQSAYKNDSRGFKNKDYSAPLPNLLNKFHKILKDSTLDDAYDRIIEYLSMGEYNQHIELKDIKYHPRDPENRQKWNIRTRYAIVNFIPLIFGNKKTVEFRHHDINLNPSIIINELIINISIIKYTLNNLNSILEGNVNISLNNILENYLLNNPRQLDNAFIFLEQKRSDLCASFNRNEIFTDFTKNTYKSIIKTESTIGNIDKLFDIEFFKKWNKSISFGNLSTSSNPPPTLQSFRFPSAEPTFTWLTSNNIISITDNSTFRYNNNYITDIMSISGMYTGNRVTESATILNGKLNDIINKVFANNVNKDQIDIDDLINLYGFFNISFNYDRSDTILRKMSLLSRLLLDNNDDFLNFANKTLGLIVLKYNNNISKRSINIRRLDTTYFNSRIRDLRIGNAVLNGSFHNNIFDKLLETILFLYITNTKNQQLFGEPNTFDRLDPMIQEMIRIFNDLNICNLSNNMNTWTSLFNSNRYHSGFAVPAIYLTAAWVRSSVQNRAVLLDIIGDENMTEPNQLTELIIMNSLSYREE